jgi:hypothetical protein
MLGRFCDDIARQPDFAIAATLGYGRLEDPELVGPISALYREVGPVAGSGSMH